MRQAFLQSEIGMAKKWRRVLSPDVQYGLFDFCQVVFSKGPTLKRREIILKYRIGIFDPSLKVLGMELRQKFRWSRVANNGCSECSHRANFIARQSRVSQRLQERLQTQGSWVLETEAEVQAR